MRSGLVRDDQSRMAAALYRVLGVADPAHYLHYLILRDALDRFVARKRMIPRIEKLFQVGVGFF